MALLTRRRGGAAADGQAGKVLALMPAPMQNLVGRQFTRLTVVGFAGWRQFTNGRERTWTCRCVCGKELVVPQRYLMTDGTKSCGCLIGQHKRTHGMTNTLTFRAWSAMRSRCTDTASPSYQDYGGRGISVCARWDTFEAFFADMGEKPDGKSVDRINNDGNYEPGNCRWATRVEQSNNRRSSKRLTIGGVTKTYAEWEHERGLNPGMVFKRLAAGWPTERVLEPPRRCPARRRDGGVVA